MLSGIRESPAAGTLAGSAGGHRGAASGVSFGELRAALATVRRVAPPVLLIDEFERCFDLPDGFAFPRFFDSLRSLLGGGAHGANARAVVTTRRRPSGSNGTGTHAKPIRRRRVAVDACLQRARVAA